MLPASISLDWLTLRRRTKKARVQPSFLRQRTALDGFNLNLTPADLARYNACSKC